jgi:hypothetical protein
MSRVVDAAVARLPDFGRNLTNKDVELAQSLFRRALLDRFGGRWDTSPQVEQTAGGFRVTFFSPEALVSYARDAERIMREAGLEAEIRAGQNQTLDVTLLAAGPLPFEKTREILHRLSEIRQR